MTTMPSVKFLAKRYGLDEEELWNILFECFRYHLSEDELEVFIIEHYFKLEMRLNKRYQK